MLHCRCVAVTCAVTFVTPILLCCAVLCCVCRRAAGNLSSGAAFTSLAFSADGSLLFAGGRSKFVCVYDVAERVLLRRFQVGAALCWWKKGQHQFWV